MFTKNESTDKGKPGVTPDLGVDPLIFEDSEAPADSARLEALINAVGLRVRRTRQKRGLTRKQLSSRSGVSLRYLAQLEGGGANVSLTVLWKVAESLGVELVELVPDSAGALASAEPLDHLVSRLSPRERQWAYELLLGNLGATSEKNRGIALIGMRGAGKSTLGSALAVHYKLPFVRLSDVIRELGAMDVGELFSLGGQTLYRRLEQQALQHAILSHSSMVLEVGGSLAMQEMTYDLLLRSFHTVWVRCSPKQHMQRVINQGDLRPMAGNVAAAMNDLNTILERRIPQYRLADQIIDTGGSDIDACLRDLIRYANSRLSE